MTNSDTIRANKQAAVDFLQLVVAGRIEEAYQTHVDMQGKHHNPYFPAGFAALQQAMTEAHVQYPDKQFTIHHVLGDGDLVAVHSQMVHGPDQPAIAVVHLFRFHAGKVVELWDCGQPIPADSPNVDGSF